MQTRAPSRARGGRGAAMGTAASVTAALALGATPAALGTTQASAAPGPESTLVVEADQPFRDVTTMASGSLYGLADEGVPSDDLIAPIEPDTFVQMPPGGVQQPTGDTLDVWRTAERNGAGVVVRLSDYYPGFPYQFDYVTEEDREAWADVVRGVVAEIEAAGVTNVVAYAPWNEPNLTWDEEKNGSFLDFWQDSVEILREAAPGVPIQGPAWTTDISPFREFLEFAVETETVPDVLEWHELVSASLIPGHVREVEGILDDLGLGDIPVDITEYATPQEVGIPGSLVGYVAELERYGVDRAELPFWNQSGTLGDLLTSRGGSPNGAYWLYTWYAQMSGQMVTTTPPSEQSPLDGAASVTDAEDEVRIIAGGGSGPTSVVVDGLDELAVGDTVDVELDVTPSYGRTTPTEGPITISTTTYEVGEDGSITVPVVMNPAYGYQVVVTPASGAAESLAGSYTVANRNSELLLDTESPEPAAGDRVVQDGPADEASQTWEVRDAGRGLYEVVDADTGLALAAEGAANGSPVLVQPDEGAETQQWQLVPDGHGAHRFANYGTGLVLAVEGMSTEAGAPVIQWTDGSPQSTCRPDGPRAEGRIGTALDFCGTDSYVDVPDGVVSGLDGDWTISTWIRPATLPTWARVFDFGAGAGANMFLTVSAGNGPRFAITTGGGGAEQQVTWGGQNFPLDQWSHVAITVSGTTATMWVDGEAVASNDEVTISPADLGLTTSNYLGRSQYSSDPPYDGAIDDFAVYSRALSEQELGELASGQPAEGDVLDYSFDGGTSVVEDSSGEDLDGEVVVRGGGAGGSTTATDEELADRFWTLLPVAAGEDWATDTSLLEVLHEDTSGPERRDADSRDFDLVTVAVDRVLERDPGSPVSVLADPTQPVTAFLPDDGAFMALLEERYDRRIPNEVVAAQRLRSRAQLPAGELEALLLGHVVPGVTLTSEQVLASDGEELTTAAGSTLVVRVEGSSVALLDASGAVVAQVDADRLDLNRGQVQIAHVVDRVILTS